VTESDALALLPDAAIHDRLGIVITTASPTQVVGTMPVAGNTQPYGLLHGGASLVLAESLGSFGAAIAAGGTAAAVGIEINASHHRSVSEGTVTGVATPIRHGRTLSTWEVRLSDDDGRLICTARITCLLRPLSDVPDS
jgi:1,4-dihydroxy-2-naphthoyl-CoA hydrolase